MAEGLAPSSDEQAGVLSLHVQHNGIAGFGGACGITPGNIDGYVRFDIHKPK